MRKISAQGVCLKIDGGDDVRTIDLGYEIGQVVELEGKIIVRFQLRGEKTPDRNIVCLASNGDQIWQVQDPDEYRTGKKFEPRDLFGGIWINERKELWAGGRSSDFLIDLRSGRILKEEFTK